jgi:hypothetical protein
MTEPTLLSLIRQVRSQRRSQPDALEGERLRLENSLIEFVEEAWPYIDAAPYQPNWAIDALCEHLQAVTEGRISRLLINFPPRCGKTIISLLLPYRATRPSGRWRKAAVPPLRHDDAEEGPTCGKVPFSLHHCRIGASPESFFYAAATSPRLRRFVTLPVDSAT